MKKQLLSLSLIWTILMVSFGATNVSAQTVSKDTIKDIEPKPVESNSTDKQLGKALNTYRKDALDTPIDFDKITKESNKPLPRRKWTKGEKTFLALFIVGMAALVFLVIKYGKECEIEDPNCPIDETICPCLKYKEEK